MLEALERMATVTGKGLTAQPNAGLPRTLDGRSIYLSSPEYMAGYARQFIELGARLVGGCCGTTPEHIAAIKAAVRIAAHRVGPGHGEVPRSEVAALEPLPRDQRSRLAKKLAQGEFPVLVEIIPPKGADPTKEVEGGALPGRKWRGRRERPRRVGRHGAHERYDPGRDSPAAGGDRGTAATIGPAIASLGTIQADLLGAHALGLTNILAVTGYPPQFATYPGASDILEVDAIGLVNILNNLNRGLDAGGNPLGTQTGFLVGVALNPQALNPDEELRRFAQKVAAGADFAVTPPVFDVAQLARFLERLGARRIPVLAGIWPLTSLRNAEYLNNEAPGVSVPPAIMERMRKASTGDKARAEGLKIAQEILRDLRGLVQGVQIAAPFGRVALAAEVAQVLRSAETHPGPRKRVRICGRRHRRAKSPSRRGSP